MAHQLSVVLSNEEYAALAAASAKADTSIEAVVHERLAFQDGKAQAEGDSEVPDILYRQGVVASILTSEADAPDEEAEAERLARLLGGGTSAAEMVSEDRGLY